MGYIPPPPTAFDVIEITSLEDVERRDIGGTHVSYAGLDRLRPQAESDVYSHKWTMAGIHAQTMRDARRGTWILLAMVLAIFGVIAQAAGVL
jgi:hypothetical protein